MRKNDKQLDITAEVLQKIKARQVTMKARWKFLAEKIGLESGLLLLLVAFLFVLSLFLYYWQNQATKDWLSFGYPGLRQVFLSAPYELLAGALLLVLLINFLIKKFTWGYRRSWLVWIAVLVIGGGIGASVISSLYAFYQLDKYMPAHGWGQTLGNYYQKRVNHWQGMIKEGQILSRQADQLQVEVEGEILLLNEKELHIRPPHWRPMPGDKVRLLFISQGNDRPWGMRPSRD